MYGLGCLLRRPPLDTGGTRSFEAAGCDGRDTVVIVAADHQIPVMPTAEPVNRVILHCRQQSKKQHWRCSSIQDQSIQHHLGKICNSLAAFWVIPCLLLLLVSRKWHWKTRWDFWLIVFVDDKLLNSSIILDVWIEDTFELSHWQMCLWSSPFSLLFLRSTALLQALAINSHCLLFIHNWTSFSFFGPKFDASQSKEVSFSPCYHRSWVTVRKELVKDSCETTFVSAAAAAAEKMCWTEQKGKWRSNICVGQYLWAFLH